MATQDDEKSLTRAEPESTGPLEFTTARDKEAWLGALVQAFIQEKVHAATDEQPESPSTKILPRVLRILKVIDPTAYKSISSQLDALVKVLNSPAVKNNAAMQQRITEQITGTIEKALGPAFNHVTFAGGLLADETCHVQTINAVVADLPTTIAEIPDEKRRIALAAKIQDRLQNLKTSSEKCLPGLLNFVVGAVFTEAEQQLRGRYDWHFSGPVVSWGNKDKCEYRTAHVQVVESDRTQLVEIIQRVCESIGLPVTVEVDTESRTYLYVDKKPYQTERVNLCFDFSDSPRVSRDLSAPSQQTAAIAKAPDAGNEVDEQIAARKDAIAGVLARRLSGAYVQPTQPTVEETSGATAALSVRTKARPETEPRILRILQRLHPALANTLRDELKRLRTIMTGGGPVEDISTWEDMIRQTAQQRLKDAFDKVAIAEAMLSNPDEEFLVDSAVAAVVDFPETLCDRVLEGKGNEPASAALKAMPIVRTLPGAASAAEKALQEQLEAYMSAKLKERCPTFAITKEKDGFGWFSVKPKDLAAFLTVIWDVADTCGIDIALEEASDLWRLPIEEILRIGYKHARFLFGTKGQFDEEGKFIRYFYQPPRPDQIISTT